MSSNCGQCGARSTIWLPTCVFCGEPVSSGSLPSARPVPRIPKAACEGPCTERRESGKPGWFEAVRLFLMRLTHRPAATRP